MATANNKKIKVISAGKKTEILDVTELVNKKDLLYFLILKEIKVFYGQTILGLGWVFLSPAISVLLFSILFSKLTSINTNHVPYPVFCLSGLLPWIYFSQTIQSATNSLINNSKIISKTYFPRIFIPMTPVIAKIIDLIITLPFLIMFALFYNIYPTLQLFLIIPTLATLVLFTSGLSLWLSSLALKYRDIKFALSFIIQLLLFASPVIFPSFLINENFGSLIYLIYGIYPLSGIIEGFRSAVLGLAIPWQLMLISFISTLLFTFSGLWYFRNTEKTFADL